MMTARWPGRSGSADGEFAFHRPDGTTLPASPSLPEHEGTIESCHDADISPDTIVPSWYGERLDLDYAITVCFANAETRSGQRERPEPCTICPPHAVMV